MIPKSNLVGGLTPYWGQMSRFPQDGKWISEISSRVREQITKKM